LSQTAFELWKPKENSGRQQLSGAPHATNAKSVDKHVRRELDCTPTLARINTDYDPESVVSTAQSNNMDFSFPSFFLSSLFGSVRKIKLANRQLLKHVDISCRTISLEQWCDIGTINVGGFSIIDARAICRGAKISQLTAR